MAFEPGMSFSVTTAAALAPGILLLLAAVAGAQEETTEVPAVRNVGIAHIREVPFLYVDGEPVPPVIFFYNTDAGRAYLEEQVKLSAGAGVHIYSLPLRCPRKDDGATPDYAWGEGLLDLFIEHDPKATFILRLFPGPHPFWAEWAEIPKTEVATFADGSTGSISIASDWFWEPSNEDLAALIRHFEASEYGARILAYHPGGPDSEMFMEFYRERGPDYSEANQGRFRAWLRDWYETDEALRAAWGDSETTMETAAIPAFEPGRFPMHSVRTRPIQSFYRLPEQQAWVDYSRYASDITADRIIDWANLIKEETNGRRLAVFFYGYTMELPGSFSGHYALRRVLECPDVHVLASPYSYHDRFAGGAASFMSPVDSVTRHGKLWVNEDDSRTSLMDPELIKPHFELFDKRASDLVETTELLERNLVTVIAHRAGTWWMDLAAVGAFNHPEVWRMLERRRRLYDELVTEPAPYRPDVAFIVDEQSKFHMRSDWDLNFQSLFALRDACAKTGASVGYYLLEDFIDNIVPRCKVYVFGNAYYLDDARREAVLDRLNAENATALWVYAPGYIGPDGAGAGGVARLTGMQVTESPGPLGSHGEGPLAGLEWGTDQTFSPRLAVAEDGDAQVLGRYRADGAVSLARTKHGAHTSVFAGDVALSPSVLRTLFREAGAHIWNEHDDVLRTDNRILMVHSGSGGERVLRIPSDTFLRPLGGQLDEGPEPGTTMSHFEPGETRVFRVIPAR